MQRTLAIEWDDQEIRAAVGVGSFPDMVVEQLERIPVPRERVGLPEEFARFVAEASQSRGWRKLRTMVCLGRSQVELKELSLPPVPDEELPDLVRFQALREFNNLTETAPLDYLAIPGDPEQPRTVIAAALTQSAYDQVLTVCRIAGLQCERIVLRPIASAALLSERLPETLQVRLLLDVLPTELDLTVLTGSTPELMRTARLATEHEPGDTRRQILNEVRRTIAASSNRLRGRRIDRLVLCGDGTNQTELAEHLERELKLPVGLFDPLGECRLTAELSARSGGEHSHYAPLIGLLVTASLGHAPPLDFLHPHRRPEPPNRTRSYTLAGILAASVAALLIFWPLSKLWALDRQIEATKNAAKMLIGSDSERKAREDLVRIHTDVDRWLTLQLDPAAELRRISDCLPSNKEVIVDKINYNYGDRNNPPNFTIQGLAAASADVDELVNNLTALNPPPPTGTGKLSALPTYKIQRGPSAVSKNSKYPLEFKVIISIRKPSPMQTKLGPPPVKDTPVQSLPAPTGRTSTTLFLRREVTV